MKILKEWATYGKLDPCVIEFELQAALVKELESFPINLQDPAEAL